MANMWFWLFEDCLVSIKSESKKKTVMRRNPTLFRIMHIIGSDASMPTPKAYLLCIFCCCWLIKALSQVTMLCCPGADREPEYDSIFQSDFWFLPALEEVSYTRYILGMEYFSGCAGAAVLASALGDVQILEKKNYQAPIKPLSSHLSTTYSTTSINLGENWEIFLSWWSLTCCIYKGKRATYCECSEDY